MKRIYDHVEISFFNEETHFWSVDAWKGNEDEGKVVGVIHESGDAYIYDPDAIICENVREAVADKVAQIKDGNPSINGYDEEEIFALSINKDAHPKVYAAKKSELIDSGMTESEADAYINDTQIVMEVYHTKQGLFAVESDAIEWCEITNPYNGVRMKK